MDQTRPPAVGESLLRWLLGGLVIAGILAMHVLGGHDGGGSESMAMAPTGLTAPATDMNSLSMTGPSSTTPAVSPTAGAPMPVESPVDVGTGMSDMSCCVLFLITGSTLVLLALAMAGRFGVRSAGGGGTLAGAMTRRRGPPAPPRFSLCVLRA